MDSPDILEGYLIRSGLDYEAADVGTWIVHDDGDVDNIVIQFTPPVVVFRVKLMEVPGDGASRSALFERLLQLNGSEMISGAYGLEGSAVIVTETLQAENLDHNEFQAAIDGITLSIADHYETLKGFHTAPSGD